MNNRKILLVILALTIMAASVTASSLTSTSTYTNPQGLIAYWDMTNSSNVCGVTAADRSDFANTGTFQNSPTCTTGWYGAGVNFNGGTQYISLPNSASLNYSTSRTMSAWVYCLDCGVTKPGGTQIYTDSNAGDAGDLFLYTHNGGDKYWGCVYYNGSQYCNSARELGLNASWHHLACVYTESTISFYRDGVLIASDSLGCNVNTAKTFNNHAIAGVTGGFNGTIDEVKIWNRALSAQEIYIDYLGTFANIESYYQSLTTSNITQAQNYILGNMSNNFTNIQTNLTTIQTNFSTIQTNMSTIITNIANVNTTQNANALLILNNETLILGNQTLILGNESTIITNIATLQTEMGNNFTYTNGQISLVLGNQTFILGNQTIILTNLANVNSTQNANALLILNNQTLILGNETTIITNIASLNSNMAANFTYDVGLKNEILGNETLIENSLTSLNGNLSANFTNLQNLIAYLNGNMSSNFSYDVGLKMEILGNETLIEGSLNLISGNQTYILGNVSTMNGNVLLVLGNQTYILGNETTILANLANVNSTQNGNYVSLANLVEGITPTCNYNPTIQTVNVTNQTLSVTVNNTNTTNNNIYNYTTTLNITNQTVSVNNYTLNVSNGSTIYYLNQSVQANTNVGGNQQWLNFQILLLVMALAFLGFGIWRHNNPMISMGSIILILLGLSIYSNGINSGVSNVNQVGNYTYNGYAQLTNITSGEVYAYGTWKNATSDVIGLLLSIFGCGVFIYSALYIPYSNRRGK